MNAKNAKEPSDRQPTYEGAISIYDDLRRTTPTQTSAYENKKKQMRRRRKTTRERKIQGTMDEGEENGKTNNTWKQQI